jgi:transcriptional regulator with XRE-family HTH domain
MSNIITGRQLRAARILAGLTQKQLASRSTSKPNAIP